MISTRPGPFTFQKRPSMNTTPRSYSRKMRIAENSSRTTSATSTPLKPNVKPIIDVLLAGFRWLDRQREAVARRHAHALRPPRGKRLRHSALRTRQRSPWTVAQPASVACVRRRASRRRCRASPPRRSPRAAGAPSARTPTREKTNSAVHDRRASRRRRPGCRSRARRYRSASARRSRTRRSRRCRACRTSAGTSPRRETPMPSRISPSPTKLIGRSCNANRPISRQIAPATPGSMKPGFANSKNRPYMPIITRISATLGSVIVARKRLRQSGCKRDDRRRPSSRGRASPLSRAHAAAVELGEQVGHVGGGEVDHVLRERLARRQAHRLAHRALGPVDVAPAHLREAADVGGGVVHLLSRFGRLRGRGGCRRCRRAPGMASPPPRADLDRRRGAEIGAGRHRGDVARVDDVGARARRPRPARPDERRDRHRRREDRLDDRTHREVEAAGRIEFEHGELRVIVGGAPERADDEIGARRPDRACDRDHHDRRARGARCAGE